MTTSVMFVTYNRINLTKRTLENLYQTINVPYRLIIVDNGSTDGTIEWLQSLSNDHQLCQSVNIHLNDANLGIAIGRNQCLKIADSFNDDWLCTLDNDVELPVGWLKECIEIIEANPNFCIGVNMEGHPYPVITRNGKPFQYKAAGNLGTACTVFHRRLHEKIGFFTMEYERYGEEDADFFYRARIARYELGYLITMGNHFGVGELDTGEYRQFKDECRKKNIGIFQKNCRQYMSGLKPFYIPFS